MTLSEKLRFILLYGKIVKKEDTWTWTAAPDKACAIREISSKSRWDIVEYVYDAIKSYK